MLFEIISMVFGIIKLLLYKLIYPFRINFKSIPRLNNNFKIAIKRKSKLIIGKKFRSRYNVSFRIYNGGIVSIGDNCFMNDSCSINCQKRISIGNNVIFGQNVMLFDHDHDYKNDINNFVRDDIVIGNNVWIGANVTILKGVKIGDNVVIGANSLVTRNVDNGCVFYQKKDFSTKVIKYE